MHINQDVGIPCRRDLRFEYLLGPDKAPLPRLSHHWTSDELVAFAAKFRRRGHRFWNQEAWELQLHARAQRIDEMMSWRMWESPMPLPPEVIAETTLEQRASARCPFAPRLALEGHHVARLLGFLAQTGGTDRAARRYTQGIGAWLRKQSGWCSVDVHNAELWLPGLRLRVTDSTVRIKVADLETTEVVACPGTLPLLRRLVVHWRRCLRMLAAISLSLVIPSYPYRQRGDRVIYGVKISDTVTWVESGDAFDSHRWEKVKGPRRVTPERVAAGRQWVAWALANRIFAHRFDLIVTTAASAVVKTGETLLNHSPA